MKRSDKNCKDINYYLVGTSFKDKNILFDLKNIEKILKGANESRVLFVSFVGMTKARIGKKIGRLIKMCPKEKVDDVVIYGPVLLSELCNIQDSKDKTNVFFFDFECLNKLQINKDYDLIVKIVAPYASITSVVVTVSYSYINEKEIEFLEKIIDIFNSFQDSKERINIINDVLNIEKRNYESVKSGLIQDLKKESSKIYNDIITFPYYNTSKRYDQQGKFYNYIFDIFIEELIGKLKTCNQHGLANYRNAFDIFKRVFEATKKLKINSFDNKDLQMIFLNVRMHQMFVQIKNESSTNKIQEMKNNSTKKDDEHVKKLQQTNDNNQNKSKNNTKEPIHDKIKESNCNKTNNLQISKYNIIIFEKYNSLENVYNIKNEVKNNSNSVITKNNENSVPIKEEMEFPLTNKEIQNFSIPLGVKENITIINKNKFSMKKFVDLFQEFQNKVKFA